MKPTAFSIDRSLNRRTLLRGGVLGGAGLAAAALLGCGDDGDDEPSGASGSAQAIGDRNGVRADGGRLSGRPAGL